MSRPAIQCLLFLTACGGPGTVAVQVIVPDLAGRETPLPGIVVTALPYDRDSILALLEQRAAGPRPHTRSLDSLFQAFRGPFVAFARIAWQADQLERRRDSLIAQRERATSEAARGELAARQRSVDDSLRSVNLELSRRRVDLSRARDTLWPRKERLRADVERWESTAYAGYDSVLRVSTRMRYRDGLSDTTDATGWAHLVLPAGRWWISTRSPDPEDPNAEYYWNLPAGDTLRLSPVNARHLSRY
jgi:hypothetical protein